MADDDMNEQYFDDEDDFDWFYVEENYPLADELAETSVPDPGYAGTNAELDYSWYDFDIYEYWDDLEYGHDSYWDTAGTAVTGQKRKRAGGAKGMPQKRMKLSLKEMSGGTTMFVSMADRRKLWSRRAPVKTGLKGFALLPDWQKKCAKADTKMSVKAMPAEMRQAAEANEQDTPEGARHFDAEAIDEEEGDWEDEDEQIGPGDVEVPIGDLAQIANIDTDALQAVLRQKLGESGLETMDEGKFMETMQRMLSGDTNTDDAAGDLANSLLGTVRQDDSAFEGWLSQQGVSLDQGDDEEDAESVATAEMPESSSRSRKGKSVQISPPDSAIEMAKGGRTAQLAMHDGSPKAAKKRLAEIEQESDGSGRKRKKVTFDVPASQESEAATTTGEGQGDSMDAVSSEHPLTSGPTATPNEPASSEDPLISEPTETAKPTPSKTRATKSPLTAENDDTTAPKSKASKAKADPVLAAPGPAKSTRKRKAEAVEEEPPPPKKQTRKAAAGSKDNVDDGGPSYARATRSTRARSGK